MKRFLPYILILVILVSFFAPLTSNVILAQVCYDTNGVFIGGEGCEEPQDSDREVQCGILSGWGVCVVNGLSNILASILYLILTIASLLLFIAGTLLDYVLSYTILYMKRNIVGDGTAAYPGLTGINIAWKTIKDLMNIVFIFILVYEGIKLIIGVGSKESIKKFIVGLVLASLLINFSLFFTKALIDASNIVTIGFYRSILTSSAPIIIGTETNNVQISGISVPFMQKMGLTSFWSSASFDQVRLATGGNSGMIMIPILGTILFVIVSFVFFAISAVFIIRYLVIVILLVLSPVAYMGMALPFMKKYADQWWTALTSQLLFAPIYMVMTWVILLLMGPGGFNVGGDWGTLVGAATTTATTVAAQQGSISMVFNFAIIIGLVIASLIIAKSTSTAGSSHIKDATSKLTAFAGDKVMGGAGKIGRTVIGGAGNRLANSADLQAVAAQTGKASGGFVNRMAMYGTRAVARKTLYGTRKARDGSFDIRNASVPTSVINDAIEGTVGRTKAGKWAGLNDVSLFSNIPVVAPLSAMAGTGVGGTKGYKTEKDESDKRVRDRDAANAGELTQAEAKRDIIAGAQDKATAAEIEKMEKSLSKMSDKQVETLVSNNRELLDKLNFANSISVKQLEAINKNDQFSEEEKTKLKNHRFDALSGINDAVGIAALEKIRNGALGPNGGGITSAEYDASEKVNAARKKATGLSDSEMEMIDSKFLDYKTPEGQEFISQLRSGQVEGITANKSGKFTTSQKDSVRAGRRKPLLDVLNTGLPTYTTNPDRLKIIQRMINKGLGAKGVSGLMSQDVTVPDPAGGTMDVKVLVHPDVIDAYSVSILKRLAEELDPGDIATVRKEIDDRITALNTAGTPLTPSLAKVEKWLTNPNTADIFQ